jgi:heme exporter protein B
MQNLITLLNQDLKLSFKGHGKGLYPVALLILSLMLFTFSLGPDPQQLASLGAALLWALALLMSCQQESALIEQDALDGCLEQHLLMRTSMPLYIASKCITHWAMTGLPIVILTPLLAHLLNLPSSILSILTLTLVLGTPTLSLLAVMGTCLTLGAKNAFILRSLTILPLSIPILIFASGALQAHSASQSTAAHLSLLGASLLIAIVICPVVSIMTIQDHST